MAGEVVQRQCVCFVSIKPQVQYSAPQNPLSKIISKGTFIYVLLLVVWFSETGFLCVALAILELTL